MLLIIIEDLFIPEAKLITGNYITDIRGCFFKPYNNDEISKLMIKFDVKETFYSISKKDVIRGMHFQRPPSSQAKIITVIKGRITDVLLDLRKNSRYYGKFISIDLKERDGKSIFIPNGVAHGFLGIDMENIVLYLTDTGYSKENDEGIRYDSFGYDWGVKSPVLSERDIDFIKFEDFISPFR